MKVKNIRKRSDGRYEGRISIDGKRFSVFDTSLKKCQKKLSALKKDKALCQTVPNDMEFIDFVNFWFTNFKKPSLKETTQKFYRNAIDVHLTKIKGKISSITTIMLQDFLNSLGPSRTKAVVYMVLKQVFKKALELEYIKKNPALYITKGKIVTSHPTPYTLEEQKRILDNITDTKFSTLMLTYLLTGIRRNEALQLKKSDVLDGYLHVKGTKTENADRYVNISNKLKEKLLSLKDDRLFQYNERNIKKMFAAFCLKAGITGSPHKLRHTFATNLYYLGVPDKQRQALLGHASTQITNDIWTPLLQRKSSSICMENF